MSVAVGKSTDVALGASAGQRRAGLLLLRVYAICLFVFPSNSVVRVIGANGYVAAIVGLCCMALWVLNILLGPHDPIAARSPTYVVLLIAWTSLFASFLVLSLAGTDSVRRMAADNHVIALMSLSGVALLTADSLTSVSEVRRLVGTVVVGGSLAAVVGLVQYTLQFDLASVITQAMPGFDVSGPSDPIGVRFGLIRAAGTSLSPIEFGVSSGMLLPFAIWLALVHPPPRHWSKWLPFALLLGGVVASVSRSSIVAAGVALPVFVAMLPPKERLAAMAIAPIGLVGIFVFARGYFATMFEYITGAGTDPSVTTRTGDYASAGDLIAQAPAIGHGPGWYIFRNAIEITDNQYILTAINQGVLGVLALITWLLAPAVIAIQARRDSSDPATRLLFAAIVAASLSAAVCSATFDSLAFPIFAGIAALQVGLVGAARRLSRSHHIGGAARAVVPPWVHDGEHAVRRWPSRSC